jgi:hypothetical protein
LDLEVVLHIMYESSLRINVASYLSAAAHRNHGGIGTLLVKKVFFWSPYIFTIVVGPIPLGKIKIQRYQIYQTIDKNKLFSIIFNDENYSKFSISHPVGPKTAKQKRRNSPPHGLSNGTKGAIRGGFRCSHMQIYK